MIIIIRNTNHYSLDENSVIIPRGLRSSKCVDRLFATVTAMHHDNIQQKTKDKYRLISIVLQHKRKCNVTFRSNYMLPNKEKFLVTSALHSEVYSLLVNENTNPTKIASNQRQATARCLPKIPSHLIEKIHLFYFVEVQSKYCKWK